MTPSELASLASVVYGPRWQSAFARDFATSLRTVQRWAGHGIEKASTAESVRRFLEERARFRINPPPDDGYADRDDDAYDEFRPRIEALVQSGIAAGWHPGEVVTAIMAAGIDTARMLSNNEVVIETLEEAIATIREGG